MLESVLFDYKLFYFCLFLVPQMRQIEVGAVIEEKANDVIPKPVNY